MNEKYMNMALRLAKQGVGFVEPNPAVGAVLVKDEQVIGRGWHKKFGGPHAEIEAIEDCRKNGVDVAGATMYVTLEPCCHYGKTPPCTDAIIAAKVAKVVAAASDPSEHADGKGIEQLRKAGIEVQVGVCENEAKLLNAPFIKFLKTGKCWVILKWAQSIDGKMAWAQRSEKRRWISSEQSRQDVHRLRRCVQGILVGIGTVLADDPLLTPRPDKDKKITRIVLDSNLRVPLGCKLLATANKMPVLIAAGKEVVEANQQKREKIMQKGAEVLALPVIKGRGDINFLLDELSKRGIVQLLVEGGPQVINSFLEAGLADQIVVYIAPKVLGDKGDVEISRPMVKLSDAVGLNCVDIKRFGDDIRVSGLTEKAVNEIGLVKG
jgi:diaminohydroxyphosphoribosylaminopyrimidine deaminase/5-amino-6-(5-phosphoribosylamino)uracil reductase